MSPEGLKVGVMGEQALADSRVIRAIYDSAQPWKTVYFDG